MTRVTLYTLSTCPWCRKAKKFFHDQGIDLDYIDYDLADEATRRKIAEDILQYTDDISFPFVKTGNEWVQGYNPDKFLELLKKEGII